jgi:hypothetical protein
MAYFETVRQTSDGGYVAAGELGNGTSSVLVAKFDANGNLAWQHAFNDVGSSGTVTGTEHAGSVLQTPDGGFAILGDWHHTDATGTCCQGPLLLKLTPDGSIQWQKAYVGPFYCFFNGYSETCSSLGGLGESLQQTPDGGYVLAGAADIVLQDETPLEPWLARVDSSGALVWQENVYQVNTSTGRPLSEYFSSTALTPVGPVAIGWTENYSNGLGELLGVQADANGAVATCSQVHPASVLAATDPGLVQLATGLTVTTTSAAQSRSPVQTLATGVTATAPQC